MTKSKTHISNFGNAQPQATADREGYIEYHNSSRYAAATDSQLSKWLEDANVLVKNAAAIEIAERELNMWRL